ncbi:TnsA-like heteromeric transposase endonuclease subunit [Streptomyces sp. NPDC006654]|uniref:TnsA-like heteromeric transposase endonuclease subunit n=1 Tax=Streptomyces sp. NPDC006654 TaxID=3156897 RepID=UPI00340B8103
MDSLLAGGSVGIRPALGDAMGSAAITLSIRRMDGAVDEVRDRSSASFDLMRSAAPWRTFRWYRGQRHYSGTYWSATTQSHVLYESRLELARLLFADFDSSVHGIVAQPFLLKAVVDGRPRRHVPDYFLITERGPVVVDVKPRRRLSAPEVASTLEWTRQALAESGCHYEVWSDPSAIELENIRFLAGFRRERLFAPELLDELRGVDLDGVAIGHAAGRLSQRPEPHVRAAVHHLLWRHELAVDLTEPLRPSSMLRRTA